MRLPRRGRGAAAPPRRARASAIGLCVEIGNFDRFASAGQLASYVGLVPSESSSGEQRRQGSITKTGSRHARPAGRGRLALPPPPLLRPGAPTTPAGQPAGAIAISWSAQRRLYRTWTRLRAKGKQATVVAVAAARTVRFCLGDHDDGGQPLKQLAVSAAGQVARATNLARGDPRYSYGQPQRGAPARSGHARP